LCHSRENTPLYTRICNSMESNLHISNSWGIFYIRCLYFHMQYVSKFMYNTLHTVLYMYVILWRIREWTFH
jgi:hypothetical protein